MTLHCLSCHWLSPKYICNLKLVEQQLPASCTCLKRAVLGQA